MRFAFALIFIFLSQTGQLSAKEVYFSHAFVADFEQAWRASRLVKTDRSALYEATRKAFATELPPNFPGLADMLLRDAEVLEAAGSPEASHQAALMACLVSKCTAPVHWRLMKHELFEGDTLNALAHFSDLVVGFVGLFKWIGGPLSLSTGLSLALVLSALSFGILVTFRHAYLFGVALSARVPLASASAFALVPIMTIAYGLSVGGGVLSIFLGGLIVLPLVARGETLVFCGCVGLFACLGVAPSVKEDPQILNAIPDKLHYFTMSTQQRTILNPVADVALFERQLADDLRFSRTDTVRKVIDEVRAAHPALLDSPEGAGVLNLEGIGHAIHGEHAEALVLFEKASSLVPHRFEPMYNQIKLLKSLNRDSEGMQLVSEALALDAKEMGARIAADFEYSRDLDGFAIFSSVPIWHAWMGPSSLDRVMVGVDCVLWILGDGFRADTALPLFVVVLLGLLFSRLFFRGRLLYLPCSSCGEGTLQSREVYGSGGFDCELCRLDVTSASRLARGDLHRHTLRVSFWSLNSRIIKWSGTWVYPGLRLLQTRAPVRAFFYGVGASWLTLGAVLSVKDTASSSWALGTNICLLALLWLSGVLVVRQREMP